MTEQVSDTTRPQYRIGAVSRLTGIPTDTLRIWERRYQVVEPQRAEGGNRLYSQDDISRLALIKRLVDSGHAIGTIANLKLDQLRQRLVSATSLSSEKAAQGSCRVTVLGDTLPQRLREEIEDLPGLELVGTFSAPSAFEQDASRSNPTVALLEYPTVHEDTVNEVRRLLRRSNAKLGMVVYGFGRRNAIRLLEQAGVIALHAPVGLSELRRLCLEHTGVVDAAEEQDGELASSLVEPIPPRRFNNEELARLATASTTVKCECPHHLADLVMSLSAFENYSAECESRSAEDAALHAYLHVTTAKARSMLEQALARVAEAEGLEF
jgi:DNA-binding transcriptional MerR regulator